MSSSKITVRTAVAPEGSVQIGMENYEDEYGCKNWYEYEFIAWENISDEQVAVEVELPLTYAEALAHTSSLIDAIAYEGGVPAGLMQVYMVNVSTPAEQSFLCSGFQVFQTTLDMLAPRQ